MLHQMHNQEQNSTNTAQTINSLHYHAENSRKCERTQELLKSQGVSKLFAAIVYTNNLQVSKCFSTQVCCRVRPPSPPYLPPKNSSDVRESHDPTRPGQGGQGWVPTRGYRYWVQAVVPYGNPTCLSTQPRGQ